MDIGLDVRLGNNQRRFTVKERANFVCHHHMFALAGHDVQVRVFQNSQGRILVRDQIALLTFIGPAVIPHTHEGEVFVAQPL